ncbi:MAG: DNA replication protein [Claussenomyces sp. TS43310]|nr:MAG: DNA replication protein [Claussenomyces sp. TS43310]
MSYYDVDAILTDAQKVPCTFELDCPHLGYLDAQPSLPLKSGTNIPLPLWLAEMLAVSSPSSSKTLITLDLPTCFGSRVMNALKADPKSVDLRAQAQNFFALGARILELFEEDTILHVLTETFRVRAAEIGDFAANAGGNNRTGGGPGLATDGVEFLRGLEEGERQLFRTSHESAKALKSWMGDVKKA